MAPSEEQLSLSPGCPLSYSWLEGLCGGVTCWRIVVRMGVGRSAGPRLEQLVGPLECRVLRALWQGGPVAVADVLERVNGVTGAGLAYTTVMTVLGRLHDKGLVDRSKRGRGYVYTVRYSEPELVQVLSRREVDRVVDRYGDAALSAFVTRLEEADPALLDRVRRLAEGRSS